jgi:hypothetical protein
MVVWMCLGGTSWLVRKERERENEREREREREREEAVAMNKMPSRTCFQ